MGTSMGIFEHSAQVRPISESLSFSTAGPDGTRPTTLTEGVDGAWKRWAQLFLALKCHYSASFDRRSIWSSTCEGAMTVSNLEKYRKDLKALLQEGGAVVQALRRSADGKDEWRARLAKAGWTE